MTGAMRCLSCGSIKLELPGFVSFRFYRGHWRPKRGSEEIADGAPIHCYDCGKRHVMDDICDPATLQPEDEPSLHEFSYRHYRGQSSMEQSPHD